MRKAFTLIEVMISVMIISVVILALLEMFANNSHIFSILDKKTKVNQYASLFVANPDYGLEKKSVFLDDLVSDFKVTSELRQELKSIKVEIIYQELSQIDMSEYDEADVKKIKDVKEEGLSQNSKKVTSDMVFDIGKTVIKTDSSSTSFLRIRQQ